MSDSVNGETQRSSVKIMRGAKGDPSWEVKVYDTDVDAAMMKALEIDMQLRLELKGETE